MTPTPSLLALPDPIFNESPASWMMRLSQYHQSWPNQICDTLGLRKITDFDMELSLESSRKLSYATAVKETSLSCLDSMFFHIRICEQRQAAFLLNLSPRGYSSYRYCPDCLREDLVPYWRFTWRMAYFQICPSHRCVMSDRCLSCDSVLEASPVKKQGFFEDSDQPICRFCPICRADLGQFRAETLTDCERLRAVLALQRVVTAALLHGWFSVYGAAGRFALENLPRVLMMGALRCEESGDATRRKGSITSPAPLSPYIEKKYQRNEDMPRKRIAVSDKNYEDDLCQSANMAWKARFSNAIDEIRRMNN